MKDEQTLSMHWAEKRELQKEKYEKNISQKKQVYFVEESEESKSG